MIPWLFGNLLVWCWLNLNQQCICRRIKYLAAAILQTGNLCEKTTFLSPPREFRWNPPRLSAGKVLSKNIKKVLSKKLQKVLSKSYKKVLSRKLHKRTVQKVT